MSTGSWATSKSASAAAPSVMESQTSCMKGHSSAARPGPVLACFCGVSWWVIFVQFARMILKPRPYPTKGIPFWHGKSDATWWLSNVDIC